MAFYGLDSAGFGPRVVIADIGRAPSEPGGTRWRTGKETIINWHWR